MWNVYLMNCLIAVCLSSLTICVGQTNGRLIPTDRFKVYFHETNENLTESVAGTDDRLSYFNSSASNATVNPSGVEPPNGDYWTDSDPLAAWPEKLRRLRPSIQCRGKDMTLRIRGRRASQLLIERGGDTPIPLSQLPSHCGYSVRRHRRNLMMVAPYDGCHVIREAGSYVLPLDVWGTPLKMSCPIGSYPPPEVSCFPSEMVVKIPGAPSDLQVRMKEMWQSLPWVCEQCGFSVEEGPEQLVLTAPYTSACRMTGDDGHALSLLLGGRKMTFSCPATILSVASDVPSSQSISPPCFDHPIPASALAPLTPPASPQYQTVPFYYFMPQWLPTQCPVPVTPTVPPGQSCLQYYPCDYFQLPVPVTPVVVPPGQSYLQYNPSDYYQPPVPVAPAVPPAQTYPQYYPSQFFSSPFLLTPAVPPGQTYPQYYPSQ